MIMSKKSEIEKLDDLEIKDAHLIFNNIWTDLEKKLGRQNLRFPKEIIWLGGAPGSGKGTNTEFILRERGITEGPIIMSSLLDSEEARRIKDVGGMVGDKEAVGALLNRLLDPKLNPGALVDGFPRTKVQVECLKLLYQKMLLLRSEYFRSEYEKFFPRPIFRVILLFVEEGVSVERQLKRGQEAREFNSQLSKNSKERLDERATDFSIDLAKGRYRNFKERNFSALQSLKEVFHYHFVDASGPIPSVEKYISKELQYQSLLELNQETYDRIRSIPLASEIVIHARQELVTRLDTYEREHKNLFEKVAGSIEKEFIPIILRHAISGEAQITLEHSLYSSSLARSMLIDIFSERGFHAVIDMKEKSVADSLDKKTYKIIHKKMMVYHFLINFPGCEIRRGQ